MSMPKDVNDKTLNFEIADLGEKLEKKLGNLSKKSRFCAFQHLQKIGLLNYAISSIKIRNPF
jgi:hypothetical protein